MSGVTYGLIAAILLGVNTILIALAARRWGVWRTTAATLIIAYFVLIAYLVVMGIDFPLDAGGLWPLMGILGFAAGSSYFAGNQSLKLGPVAVASPIGSTTGVMTVLFAFVFLGERPDLIQWLGIPLAGLGIVLLSLEVDELGERRIIGWGPVFAIIGVVTGAASNVGLSIPAQEIGPVPTAIAQRTFTVLYVLIVMVFVARSRSEASRMTLVQFKTDVPALPIESHLGIKAWLMLGVLGLLDAAAFIMFAEGLAIEDAWLIGLLSQSGRIIAVVGGYVLFKERLQWAQWLGFGLAILGLVLVAIA